MKKIIATGLNGLVGSQVAQLLKEKYEFKNISRSTGVDITSKEQVLEAMQKSDGQIVLHLAGKTNVDACELDKTLGENGEAWKINVDGTKNVAEACLKTEKKLIYISTDFVFDGEKSSKDGYSENDTPNPINWYGQTKYEAEKAVSDAGISCLIARISYPYRSSFEKNDFARAMLNRLKQGQKISAVTDHVFCPTFIDDIAWALEVLIEQSAQGIYHVTGTGSLTPYEAAIAIAKTFDLDEGLVEKTTREVYFKNGAPRPFYLAMNNAKIKSLGVNMRSFEEGLEELKKQIAK
ncbi:MAG TPA: SDR family oxidoreductase [Candidatus Saccharimonadales bacterium]|nr:SDR family oxidoreductase [Candidatus Saccharimonadales bacterium]